MDAPPPRTPAAPPDGPWDPGHPQPALVTLAAEPGRFPGRTLVVGCGCGEEALHLAGLGLPVVGVDGSAAAIDRARVKGRERGLRVPFEVADPGALGRLRARFETALDAGAFAALPPAGRRDHAGSLAEAVAPGGLLHLLCPGDREPPAEGLHRASDYDLRAAFRPAFVLAELREVRLEQPGRPEGVDGWLATFRRM